MIHHVASVSGGRTSAYLVHLLEEKRKTEGWDVTYIYMDTGAEHPATYNFLRNIVSAWGVHLICLRVKYNSELGVGCDYDIVDIEDVGWDLAPWVGMVTKYGTPSVASPYCTSRMKTEPHDKFCNDYFGKKGGGGYITWLGIRADEPSRLSPKTGVRFLAELSDFGKEDVLSWWKNQPFDLGISEHLRNCVFCIKKGLNKVALAAKDEPILAAQFIAATEGAHVRTEGRKFNHKRMYRTSLHLSDVITMYAGVDRDDLFKRLRSTRAFDSGSCSESCEIIGETP